MVRPARGWAVFGGCLALVVVALAATVPGRGSGRIDPNRLAALRSVPVPAPPAGWQLSHAWEQRGGCSARPFGLGDCAPSVVERSFACACGGGTAVAAAVVAALVRSGLERVTAGPATAGAVLRGSVGGLVVHVQVAVFPGGGPGFGPPGSEQLGPVALRALDGGDVVVVRVSDTDPG